MPFLETNNIRLHYLEHPGNGPLLIMMHGLTANAHAFDGIIDAGLEGRFRIISVDLRGRGLSDHPIVNYTMEDHAQDVLGLMDHLSAEKASFCGHSFGGLLSFYLGSHYPERVDKLVILDAAARMNPRTPEMLSFRLSTLDIRYPSMEDYMKEVKDAPYMSFWSDLMSSYFNADVESLEEGSVMPRPKLANMVQASLGVAATQWPELLPQIQAPVLLINAPEAYTFEEPLLPPDFAQETVDMLPNARLITVPGNHQTMMYGEGAQQIAAAILQFVGNNN
jgi:pimeloyl-ACP methyl ester carboxylesterase